MPKLGAQLELPRCPHCRVDTPSLGVKQTFSTTAHDAGSKSRTWKAYACRRCGGVTTAWAWDDGDDVQGMFPASTELDEHIDERARDYLKQAMDTLHAPAGSVMLSASAVDAMLKAKDYKDGSLYGRINKASDDHLITPEMAAWAHDVRLDANDQRHSDDDAELPSEKDAQHSINFAQALAQLLFVLPAQVQRGLKETSVKPP